MKFSAKKFLIGLTILGSFLGLTSCKNKKVEPTVPPIVTPARPTRPTITYPEIPIYKQTTQAQLADYIGADFFSSKSNFLPIFNKSGLCYINIKNQTTKLILFGDYSNEEYQAIQNSINYLNQTFSVIDSNIKFTLTTGRKPFILIPNHKDIYINVGTTEESIFSPLAQTKLTGRENPVITLFSNIIDNSISKNPNCDELKYRTTIIVHELMHAFFYEHTATGSNSIMEPSSKVNSFGFTDNDLRYLIYNYSNDRSLDGMYNKYCQLSNSEYTISTKSYFDNKLKKLFIQHNSNLTKLFDTTYNYEINASQIIKMENKYFEIILNKNKTGFYDCKINQNGKELAYQGTFCVENVSDLLDDVNYSYIDAKAKYLICLKNFKYFDNNGEIKTKDLYIKSNKVITGSNAYNWKEVNFDEIYNSHYFEDKTKEYLTENHLINDAQEYDPCSSSFTLSDGTIIDLPVLDEEEQEETYTF